MVRKKVVRQRGHRTHGWGSPKKHRGKGSRGGRGMAGSEKHRKTYVLKYARDRIGKQGFTAKRTKNLLSINLREAAKLAGKSKKLDLTALGYDKLLGTGEIKAALEIKVDYFSAGAKQKVEAAGGKIISDAVVEEAVEEVVEETVEE
ncbi:MAG: uL15 family ribosomal protein [Candidatus Aenigmatarchaeota archaeon]|nr:MAG: uL15 family ribosomal protein [Candidatus Aenigmarchaeota archaeon]